MKKITDVEGFSVRTTTREDANLILEFIKGLAEYEKLAHEVVATEEALVDTLFEKKIGEAIIGEYNGTPVGFAIFFHNFSTFLGKPGLYLEDLFVKPQYRGKGFGKALLKYIASVAKDRGCGRYEWTVLDWNKPSIEFYKKLGAKHMKEWQIMRVTGNDLDRLAE